MIRCNGISYPSEKDIESGRFDDLSEGQCSQVWRDRFLLELDEEGNVVATPELEKMWEDTKGERVSDEEVATEPEEGLDSLGDCLINLTQENKNKIGRAIRDYCEAKAEEAELVREGVAALLGDDKSSLYEEEGENEATKNS